MATATRDQGKTSFVKEFLGDHPQGNVQAVNEAWAAAGKNGTIGSTLINKMRSQLGLSGNLRAKSKTRTAGKTSFVKEFLKDNPQGNTNAVNEAWLAAGMKGTISPTLVNKTRASLGLTGNLRGKSKTKGTTTGKRRGRPPKQTTAAVYGKAAGFPRGRKSDRTLALLDVEAEIDRLIFTAMGIGDLPEVGPTSGGSLREAERLIHEPP